jgi:signal transduction histidine kinase
MNPGPGPQLRAFALITLGTVGVFLPLEVHYRSADVFAPLLLVYGIHVALASFILMASHWTIGVRHGERLALTLVLGHAANLELYLYCSPPNPGLVATALASLLVASPILFSWSGRRTLVVSVAACAGFVLAGVLAPGVANAGTPFALSVFALIVAAAVAVTCAHVLWRFRDRLARREEELQALSMRLMSIQEEERRRLSRELHDELGQSLTAVSSYLWAIEQELPRELTRLREETSMARRLVVETLSAMRELSQLLRPPGLDLYGLVPSLDSQLRAFGDRHRILTSFYADGLPERLSPEIETTVYRITQEALTNVARHAQARRVRVHLEAEAGALQLEVEDDGIGLPAPSAPNGGTGLTGIGERVHALGGTLTIRSGPGTCLSVRLPCPVADAA